MTRYLLVVVVLLTSCSPRYLLRKEVLGVEEELQEHAGFVLYDPERRKTLVDHHGDKYFTPASNTKIFTYFTCLKILGDSIPGIRYIRKGDSTIVWGTGDPSFLYRNSHHSEKVFDFLKSAPGGIYFSQGNFNETAMGPGWSWDDYNDYYSAERSPLPLYGNVMEITKDPIGPIHVEPTVFADSLEVDTINLRSHSPRRRISANVINVHPGMKSQSWQIPIHGSRLQTTRLLSDTLRRDVTEIDFPYDNRALNVNSIPADSLYKVMMQESDNFVAEQLLLICAGVLSDTLKTQIAIDYSLNEFLSGLRDRPEWVDGSGLSRYNLFTPRSVVQMWDMILTIVPKDKLFQILAIGGKTGTLKNYFKGESPYVFGKTGSLSNNHCLSGYLITKKGRTLIFSWMHNNFTTPSRQVRDKMEKILIMVHDKW